MDCRTDKVNELLYFKLGYTHTHTHKHTHTHTCVHAKSLQLSLTLNPWTVANQALLSMEFYRQEYWSGLPCSPPGCLRDPGIKPTSLMSPALRVRFFTHGDIWEA